MLRGSVTASLIGYILLMHVKEFGQLLIGISSLLEKISRGLYYERMKFSYLCTAEYMKALCAEIITAKRRTFPSKLPSSILRSVANCRTLTFDHFSLFCPVFILLLGKKLLIQHKQKWMEDLFVPLN